MCPGAWVMTSGRGADVAANAEVTPQAQKTGTSPGSMVTGSPKSGRSMSSMPIWDGSPIWTGAPWVRWKRVVIWTARTACSGVIGRMLTTKGAENGPAGVQARLVTYMETFLPSSMLRIGSTGGLQGVLKGETAAQKEADHVFVERVGDGFDFFCQLSIAVDPVAGQILAQIGPRGNLRLVDPGLENIEYRTGFGVADTEEKKVKGFLLRQHDQVGLNKAAGRARGRFSPFCGANPVPQLGRGEVFRVHGVFLRNEG